MSIEWIFGIATRSFINPTTLRLTCKVEIAGGGHCNVLLEEIQLMVCGGAYEPQKDDGDDGGLDEASGSAGWYEPPTDSHKVDVDIMMQQ